MIVRQYFDVSAESPFYFSICTGQLIIRAIILLFYKCFYSRSSKWLSRFLRELAYFLKETEQTTKTRPLLQGKGGSAPTIFFASSPQKKISKKMWIISLTFSIKLVYFYYNKLISLKIFAVSHRDIVKYNLFG